MLNTKPLSPLIPDSLKQEYPFKSNFIEVKGGRMHYVDEGEGTPVVMVHGNPTWSFFYRNAVKALQADFRCIVPDHIGCGLSDKPQDFSYRLTDHIENIITLIESLKLDSFHLVVHDWGGAIGFALAEHFHEKVGKIQVLNTAAFRSKRIPPTINLCRIPLLGELWIRGFNGFAGAATMMAVAKPLDKTVKAGFILPYDNWTNRIATHRFVQDIPLNENHPSYSRLLKIENELSLLKDKPMQICWGGKDFCFNDHFFEEWKERFPDAAVHYYAEAGHYLLEDEKEACLSQISSFFRT